MSQSGCNFIGKFGIRPTVRPYDEGFTFFLCFRIGIAFAQ